MDWLEFIAAGCSPACVYCGDPVLIGCRCDTPNWLKGVIQEYPLYIRFRGKPCCADCAREKFYDICPPAACITGTGPLQEIFSYEGDFDPCWDDAVRMLEESSSL